MGELYQLEMLRVPQVALLLAALLWGGRMQVVKLLPVGGQRMLLKRWDVSEVRLPHRNTCSSSFLDRHLSGALVGA